MYIQRLRYKLNIFAIRLVELFITNSCKYLLLAYMNVFNIFNNLNTNPFAKSNFLHIIERLFSVFLLALF